MTVIAHPRWVYPLFWTAGPALGGALGWLAARSAGWLAALPWLPWQGVFERVARLPATTVTVVAVSVGALAGLLFAGAAAAERVSVQFTGAGGVTLHRGGTNRVVGGPVRGAHLDGKYLVLLGAEGRELARERTDLPRPALADGFQRNGVTWYDADPYAADFRRWVPGHPDVPPVVDALLRARQKAVESGDTADADDLCAELSRHGVAVREEAKRQYWRSVSRG
jgi:hypothetical protein